MNILILTTCLSSGGAERIAADLSNGLSKHHNISICVFSEEEGVDYRFTGELFDLGIDLSANIVEKFSALSNRMTDIRTIKRKQKIDATISLLNGPNIANILTNTGDCRIITIVNCLSRTFSGYNEIPRKLLIRLLYDRADMNVTLSDGVQTDAKKHNFISSKNVRTIYNPADIDAIDQQSRESISPALKPLFEQPTLINVGRLTRQKGQDHLLRIFKRVKKEMPDVRLVILGRGERQQELQTLSETLGLDTHMVQREHSVSEDADVFFLGFRKNPFQFLRAADCFVFPTLWEGLGSVIIESLACGTPVVSSDCQYGPREILAPDTDTDRTIHEPERTKNGILMPDFLDDTYPDSTTDLYEQWSNEIVNLLKDDQRTEQLIRNGRKRAKQFDTDQIVSEWERMMNEII